MADAIEPEVPDEDVLATCPQCGYRMEPGALVGGGSIRFLGYRHSRVDRWLPLSGLFVTGTTFGPPELEAFFCHACRTGCFRAHDGQ